MADNKGGYLAKALYNNPTMAVAAFVGTAGFIAVAATTVLAAADNYASPVGGVPVVLTDNGTGDFTVGFQAGPARIIDVQGGCIGPSNLIATVQSAVLTNGLLVVRFLTKTAAGVLTDPAVTDIIRLRIYGSQTLS